MTEPRFCTFAPTGETDKQGWKRHRCSRCFYHTVPIPDLGQPIYRVCDRQQEGLGDIVARWLSAFGITKPRMESLVGGDCGCTERQAKLNQVGWELSDQWARLLRTPLRALRTLAPKPASVDTPQVIPTTESKP